MDIKVVQGERSVESVNGLSNSQSNIHLKFSYISQHLLPCVPEPSKSADIKSMNVRNSEKVCFIASEFNFSSLNERKCFFLHSLTLMISLNQINCKISISIFNGHWSNCNQDLMDI